ncbi:glutathione peroxidase [Ligilactobacillus pabuli]|uniref:Glutathione peroxidase n=1 Tax=Ligilactobacillus pabuli TaxID=2886039 RepID=A0ABQ5JK27_9LACO|nr:glutathione peroxidase [Ligilactobacillus pabuli]GKS81086.1 glutathione peroxidase [Ligilactobacillus pabuli]
MATIYDFSEEEVSGQPIDLADYKGQVLLLVNTASKCGLAPQLEQLEALYQQYHQAGFTVIGLPSNQFNQELDSDQAATEYCQLHFGVTFPMTKRVWVNGEQADPLFTYLKKETTGEEIAWNYTKFLIGRNGQIIGRYEPKTTPEEFSADIAEAVQNS